jgi:hypothetical protein
MTLADGQMIDEKVLEGIANQTVPITILPITRPVSFYEDEDQLKGLKSMTEERNIAAGYIPSTEQYVLYLDSDVVLIDGNTVALMINELIRDSKIGACAVFTKNRKIDFDSAEKRHLNTACMLIRVPVIKNLVFRNEDHNVCNCYYLTKDIYALGYKCKYLRNVFAYEIPRERHFI